MHNYFVSFTYSRGKINKYDNCIIVDTIDTSLAIASQLDDMIKRFTEQIKESVNSQLIAVGEPVNSQLITVGEPVNDIVILNIVKMN